MEMVVGAAVAAVVSATVVLLLGRQRGGRTAPAGPKPVSGGSGSATAARPARAEPGARTATDGAALGVAEEAGLPDNPPAGDHAEPPERRAENPPVQERVLRQEGAARVPPGEI